MGKLMRWLWVIGLFSIYHTGLAAMGGDFTLTDQQGKPFQLQQLRGKVVLLSFGYTYCPDICPTELARISSVLNGLGGDADQVQGLFITLDPGRDTPPVLQAYLNYFNPSLIGLTGSDAAISQVATAYHVAFQKQAQPDGDYSLDHSANLYLIDRNGQLFGMVPYGLPAAHVLQVVRSLLDGSTQ
ncbi:SCO family protein [Sedimenticola sp.]|uniref:SCO family protein n=1 Tax=Sedimenticola sp. TaxID=1940285 RepID=UPI003D098E09